MALREFRPLTQRGEEEEFEELKRFYFICEGEYTEIEYFRQLCINKKEMGINNYVDLIPLEKTGEYVNQSSPKCLLEFAREKKLELIEKELFDESLDRFYIIFDRDSFKPVDKKAQQYLDYISEASSEFSLGVTSPCFEVFLLLHHEQSVERYMQSTKQSNLAIIECIDQTIAGKSSITEEDISKYDLRQNRTLSNKHTVASKLYSTISGKNPKKQLDFNFLKNNVDIAINQERDITQSPSEMVNKLGSNIGNIISLMREDPRF